MGQLANNALRTKNMIQLLNDMGISLEGTEVSCYDELLVFKTDSLQRSEQLSQNLQSLLADGSIQPQYRQFSLEELLTNELAMSTCVDQKKEKTNKLSCNMVLQVLIDDGLKYTLDEEKEHIEFELPEPAYAIFFNMLQYKNLSIVDNKLRFNIREFLKSYPNELIAINSESPLLLINASAFEDKKVFYAQKTLETGELEIKPYFFVPYASSPPKYTFVLDTSGSMEEEDRLDTLKQSVITFAEALFLFQPQATISIIEFNTTHRTVGNYTKDELDKLQRNVNVLSPHGSTCLYEVSKEQLELLSRSDNHTNVLLFTDGKDQSDFKNSEMQLKNLIKHVDENLPLVKARNKFFVISYAHKQTTIIEKLAALFNSLVINSLSADFKKALSDVQKMQEWAAQRDLFTSQLSIDNQTTEYVQAYDMSGQFVALSPQRSTDGKVHLKIKDGSGKVILDDQRSLLKEEPVKPNSSTPSVNGFFSGSKGETSSDSVVSTLGFNLV
ncbi:VWA domain-containing protein [Legionella saoudiensis]|uniref:VWA domain-containing protein n=1 Tax=Legionella saoudiensis TaxID=1750561 RepID=UPI00073068D9|nr:vWA domain-containing protein [Legionella saoudiensis]